MINVKNTGQRYFHNYKRISQVLRHFPNFCFQNSENWNYLSKLRTLSIMVILNENKKESTVIAASVTFPVKATRAYFHSVQFNRIISGKWGKYVLVIIARLYFYRSLCLRFFSSDRMNCILVFRSRVLHKT